MSKNKEISLRNFQRLLLRILKAIWQPETESVDFSQLTNPRASVKPDLRSRARMNERAHLKQTQNSKTRWVGTAVLSCFLHLLPAALYEVPIIQLIWVLCCTTRRPVLISKKALERCFRLITLPFHLSYPPPTTSASREGRVGYLHPRAQKWIYAERNSSSCK